MLDTNFENVMPAGFASETKQPPLRVGGCLVFEFGSHMSAGSV